MKKNNNWIFPVAVLVFIIFWKFITGEEDSKNNYPNIILVMTDDQGWGQTGYYKHPILKTPNLDAMAKNGLRFDRFYAGAPQCSPTRASVLTGRNNDRTGVFYHGYPLNKNEKTIAKELKKIGYIEQSDMVDGLSTIKIHKQNIYHDVFAEVEKVAYKLNQLL